MARYEARASRDEGLTAQSILDKEFPGEAWCTRGAEAGPDGVDFGAFLVPQGAR
jgi:hypothetical protein